MDKKKTRLKGYFYLFLWAILIAAGIIEKRVYDNPDVMVFYHFPAAVSSSWAGTHCPQKIENATKNNSKSGSDAQRAPKNYFHFKSLCANTNRLQIFAPGIRIHSMKAAIPTVLSLVLFSLFAFAGVDDYKDNAQRRTVFARHLQQGKVLDVFSDCQSKLAGTKFEISVVSYQENKPRVEFGPAFHAVVDYHRQVTAKKKELIRVEIFGEYENNAFVVGNKTITHYGVVANDFDVEEHHKQYDKIRRTDAMATRILDYQAGLRSLVSRYKGFMGVRILYPDPTHLGKKDYRLEVLFDTEEDFNRYKRKFPSYAGIEVSYGYLRDDSSETHANPFDVRSWEISTPSVKFIKVSEKLETLIREAIQKDAGEFKPAIAEWNQTYEIHLHTTDEVLLRVLELKDNKVRKGVYFAEWSLKQIALATSIGYITFIELLD